MKFGTWLLGLVQPMLAKILVSLGFSVVTITGVTMAIGTVKGLITSNIGGVPAATLNLFLLAGGGVGLNIIFGAMTFLATIWTIQSATKILGTPQS